MYRTVGPVQSIDFGYGFVLYDDDGKPCASFAYSDKATAEKAANLMAQVLMDVDSIRGLIVKR
jgi:hypothetical protein